MDDFVVIFKANFAGDRSVLRWSDHHFLFQQQYAHEMNQWQSL